jgi:hypothetical protein
LDDDRGVTDEQPAPTTSATAAAEFGRRLAALHAEGAPAFFVELPVEHCRAHPTRSAQEDSATGGAELRECVVGVGSGSIGS